MTRTPGEVSRGFLHRSLFLARRSLCGALGCAFARNLRAFRSRLREPDRNRLLPTLHSSALSSWAALERAFLSTTHRALDTLRCRLAILSPTRSLAAALSFRGRHRLTRIEVGLPCKPLVRQEIGRVAGSDNGGCHSERRRGIALVPAGRPIDRDDGDSSPPRCALRSE